MFSTDVLAKCFGIHLGGILMEIQLFNHDAYSTGQKFETLKDRLMYISKGAIAHYYM